MARQLDRHVLDMAVEELRESQDTTLAINISGLTASDPSWLRALISAVRSTPHIAPRLTVEITETAALHDIEESARFVNVVRNLGCKVAIDDFGAGFTLVPASEGIDRRHGEDRRLLRAQPVA